MKSKWVNTHPDTITKLCRRISRSRVIPSLRDPAVVAGQGAAELQRLGHGVQEVFGLGGVGKSALFSSPRSGKRREVARGGKILAWKGERRRSWKMFLADVAVQQGGHFTQT